MIYCLRQVFSLFIFNLTLVSFNIFAAPEDFTLTRRPSFSPTNQDQSAQTLASDAKNLRDKTIVSSVQIFGDSPREEQENFFDFIKGLKGIPDSLKFPDTADDDGLFTKKALAALKEIDTYLVDANDGNSNWVRRVIKNLKVKSGFSNWIKSINQRLSTLETRVDEIYKQQKLQVTAA